MIHTEDSGEESADGRAGEKVQVHGGLPPAIPPLTALHNLGGRKDDNLGRSHTEIPDQTTRRQVATALLTNMCIHPKQGHHHNGVRYPSLHLRIPCASELNKRKSVTVGG